GIGADAEAEDGDCGHREAPVAEQPPQCQTGVPHHTGDVSGRGRFRVWLPRPVLRYTEYMSKRSYTQLQALAETFKVLGDTTRVRSLDALSPAEVPVCDLAQL